MVKRVLLVSLLGICLMGFLGNQAWAGVTCPPECVYKVGSRIYCGYPYRCITAGGVYCDVLGFGLGNVLKEGGEVYLGCNATTDELDQWAVVCGAPGGENPSPGQNTVPFAGGIEGYTLVNATLATKNGRVEVTVHATPTQDLLDTIWEAAFNQNIQLCSNDNWHLVDAVPCSMTLKYEQKEVVGSEICVTADATYDCKLVNDMGKPDCSLVIEPSTKQLVEKRYLCEETDSNTYNSRTGFPYCE